MLTMVLSISAIPIFRTTLNQKKANCMITFISVCQRLQPVKSQKQKPNAAPRGEAKSTLVTQLFTLWCVITERKRYPIIGMDASEQAEVMLDAIKAELEVNPRLSNDFPEACGQGRVWRSNVILTANGAKIEATGSGKRIRGRRHGAYRPDLFIGDDLENDENVASPAQRQKLMNWITKAVLKLGEAGAKFDVIIIGTILHYDSVLARLINNPMWTGRKFRALIKWPDNMALWDQWEELLLNVGKQAARGFYEAHKPRDDQRLRGQLAVR